MEQEHSDVAHDDAEYIDAVREADPATTNTIGEVVGVTRQAADYRLRQLADDGVVESTMVGNTLTWRIVDDE